MHPRQRHDSETRKPSRLEIRLANTIADCIAVLILWGIPRHRAERIVMEELEWRVLPLMYPPVEPARDVIEEQEQEAPF